MHRLKCSLIMISFVSALVLAWWGEAGAIPFNFQINRFQVIQGSTISFTDNFNDGMPPPSGPNGPNTYQAVGTFSAGDESGGSLVLNSIGAASTFSAFVSTTVLFKSAILATPILQTNGPFSVQADFAAILPQDVFAQTGVREQYRIRIRDRGSPSNNDAVGVRVRNVSGNPNIQFFKQDFSTATFTSLGAVNISLPLFTSLTELTLGMNVDGGGAVTGFFDIGSGQTFFGGTTTIYNSEDFTFAEFTAVGPVPEPGTLLLIGSGVVGMGAVTRRRSRRK